MGSVTNQGRHADAWWLDLSEEDIREAIMAGRKQAVPHDHIHQYGPVSDLCLYPGCDKQRPFEWQEIAPDRGELIILLALVFVLVYFFAIIVVGPLLAR